MWQHRDISTKQINRCENNKAHCHMFSLLSHAGWPKIRLWPWALTTNRTTNDYHQTRTFHRVLPACECDTVWHRVTQWPPRFQKCVNGNSQLPCDSAFIEVTGRTLAASDRGAAIAGARPWTRAGAVSPMAVTSAASRVTAVTRATVWPLTTTTCQRYKAEL